MHDPWWFGNIRQLAIPITLYASTDSWSHKHTWLPQTRTTIKILACCIYTYIILCLVWQHSPLEYQPKIFEVKNFCGFHGSRIRLWKLSPTKFQVLDARRGWIFWPWKFHSVLAESGKTTKYLPLENFRLYSIHVPIHVCLWQCIILFNIMYMKHGLGRAVASELLDYHFHLHVQ